MHRFSSIFATVVLLVAVAHAATPTSYIQVAGLVTSNTVNRHLESESLIHGWEIWMQEANQHDLVIGTETIGFNVSVFDIGGSYDTTLEETTKIARGDYGDFDFIFGPWGSDFSLAASVAVRQYNKVLITGLASGLSVFVCSTPNGVTCTESGARISGNTFGSVPTAEQNYGAGINSLVIEGARTIAIFAENGSFQQSARASALQAANDYGLEVLMDKIVPTNANESVALDLVTELAGLDADIVFGSQFIVGTANVVRQMRAIDYTPKSAFMRLFGQAIPADIADDIHYFLDVAVFDERLKGTDYVSELYFRDPSLYNITDPTPKKLAKAVRARYPAVTKIVSEPVAFIQGEILERAVRRALSINVSTIRETIPILVFNSILGRAAFNPFGMNDKTPPVTLQLDRDSNRQIISPLGATTTRVIYPMPKWGERTQRIQYYVRGSEIGILVFSLVGALFSVTCAIFVLKTWTTKVTKAASPPFLLLVILGSVLMYAGVLAWPLQTNDAMCIATPWLIAGGFVLLFSSIFSRTYRLLRIFANRTLEVFKVSDTHLYVLVSVICVIGAIILLLWSTVFPQQAAMITPDPDRASLDYYECQTSSGGIVFLGLTGAYMFFILAAGGVMAIRIWNIKYEVYNESKQLGFAIYNLLFFIILAVVVSTVFDNGQREISYVLRSVCINLGNLITIAALFLPKMVILGRGDKLKSWGATISDTSRTGSTSGISGTSSILQGRASSSLKKTATRSASVPSATEEDSSDGGDEKVKRLKAKVKKLKARIAELEALVGPQDEEEEEEENSQEQSTDSTDV